MSDDSDFGFGSLSPFLDDDEPSTATPEAVIDDVREHEQQRRQQQGDIGKNVDTAPEDMVPILFLDSYHCHMMNLVVNAIQDHAVQVEHIPGGCT